jgi:hypothetical protein
MTTKSKLLLTCEAAKKTAAVLIVVVLVSFTHAWAAPDWKNCTVIKISTVNEWCRHCPDWNQTFYSFKLEDGSVYVARTHRTLDVTLNGHNSLRVEKDGHVGDYIHILDDAGKDRKLRITEKIAPVAPSKEN